MPNTSVVEIPLPKNPEVFEALVWALFKELWGDATAQLHGRKGQAQSGIDIIGYDRRDGNGLVGIQCKVRGRGKRLSQRTLAKEVEKAKSFHPAISKFILATTALRDAKLQKAALELTEEHRAQGLFEVAIVAWEDIELLLSENSSILHWYSPDLFPPAFDGATEIVAPLDPGNEFRQIVGRKFVKESLLRFIRGKESGVFLLVGPPGIGKTALMANAAHELSSLCASGAAITFRFRRTSAQSSASVFIRSIYFALAKSRGVSTEQLPPDTDRSAAYFERLLNRVAPPPASASPDHGRAFEAGDTDAAWGQTNDLPITSDGARYEIFVIDAIDEADDPLLICRLLPQTLPPGVFFIISSRTGRHLDGFKALAHRCEVFPIEPLSADNLADATRFLTEMIDGWPQEIYEAIAQQARGNFLFLKLFADYAVANGVSADDGLRLAAEYGGGKEEMLTAFYEQYWLHLREESEKGGDDDSRFVDELVGLLAICFTGLTREQIICFLGWEWTVARFERTLKYVRQFLETIAALPGPLESDEKRFRLFHDTFDAFVRNRLNPDLSQLHGRVVEAYFSLSVPGFDPAKLDDYGLDHLVKHSVRCNYPDRVYEIVTPAYVKHKMGKRNSAGSILEDLDAVIGAALAEGEIELAFKYGLLESHLVASVNTPFLGIESFLRARMGETEAPLADVKTFGTPEDEILIHAEITAMTGKRDPNAATDHIRKISLLAFSCVPEVIELTVSRLAEADPIAALALSQRIPDPKLLMNVLNNREYPNKVSVIKTNGTVERVS